MEFTPRQKELLVVGLLNIPVGTATLLNNANIQRNLAEIEALRQMILGPEISEPTEQPPVTEAEQPTEPPSEEAKAPRHRHKTRSVANK